MCARMLSWDCTAGRAMTIVASHDCARVQEVQGRAACFAVAEAAVVSDLLLAAAADMPLPSAGCDGLEAHPSVLRTAHH